jgi:type IV pilus assembly protein PilW
MSRRHATSHLRPARHQGYTLVEILVALLVGVFLLVGLFTILQNTRRSSSNQSALAQLQDEQRMAMTILNDVIQNAGYFDPNTITAAAAMPVVAATGLATGLALAASQGLSGAANGSPGDTILVRYATNGTSSKASDGIEDCRGHTNPTPTTFVNALFVAPAAGDGIATALWCSPDGSTSLTTRIPLVTGVANLQIYYGVATAAGVNDVDTYMTADQVQAAGDWGKVSSVRVTVTFVNPLYRQAGYATSADQFVYLTRVIPIQGRTGVIATAL